MNCSGRRSSANRRSASSARRSARPRSRSGVYWAIPRSQLLALYMAVSALRSSRSSGAAGVTATPTLPSGTSRASANWTGSAIARLIRSASASATASASSEPGEQDRELVAEHVVDLFEPVEVQQQDGGPRRGVGGDPAQLIVEEGAVGQARERVVVRVVAESLEPAGAGDRDGQVSGERVQQGEVVDGETRRFAEPIERGHHADR